MLPIGQRVNYKLLPEEYTGADPAPDGEVRPALVIKSDPQDNKVLLQVFTDPGTDSLQGPKWVEQDGFQPGQYQVVR